jgi:hypothetical protein
MRTTHDTKQGCEEITLTAARLMVVVVDSDESKPLIQSYGWIVRDDTQGQTMGVPFLGPFFGKVQEFGPNSLTLSFRQDT